MKSRNPRPDTRPQSILFDLIRKSLQNREHPHTKPGASTHDPFYKWRAKYSGMDASLMARMKELDEENKRLKRMYAEKSMQNDLLKEALGKKW